MKHLWEIVLIFGKTDKTRILSTRTLLSKPTFLWCSYKMLLKLPRFNFIFCSITNKKLINRIKLVDPTC